MLVVRDLMCSPVWTITPQTRLPEIERIMAQNRIRHLPVLEHGRLAGMVSLGDLRQARPSGVTTIGRADLQSTPEQLTAGTLMTRTVFTIAARSPLLLATKLMLSHKIRSLVVLDAGRLVGIITASDLFAAIIRGQPAQLTAIVTRASSHRPAPRAPIV